MPTVCPPLCAATRSFVADTVTPIGAYRALAQPAASCLLESVDAGGQLSRYSFIGLDYLAVATFESSPGLVERIRSFIDAHRGALAGAREFPAAALTVFAYDAARSSARLQPREPADPPAPDAYVAIPGSWIVFDHHSHTVDICVSDASQAQAGRRAAEYERRIFARAPDVPGPVRASAAAAQSIARERYLELVDRVKSHIYEGDVYQLQLGIRFCAALEGDPLDLYRQLRSRNPSPYMFYADTPFGQLLGASPEFLVRLDNGEARIRPLAGTRSRGRSKAEDDRLAAELLGNVKERAEHVMLVDLGRNDLGAVCRPGSVRTRELMQIERYSHVMHIVSDLTGTLAPQRDALDLFAAGFPAGTVTGTPKVRAMQLIDELEPQARGFYAGSIGRLEFGGNFDSCITLRSVHVANGRVHWQASAGIVADSDPQAEYEEIFHKTSIIRSVLGADG